MVVEKALNYGFTGHFSVSVLKEIHRIMVVLIGMWSIK